MRTRRHPLSGAMYEVDDQGLVHVDQDGVQGVFTAQGDWVSGALHHVDAHLCGWLAGRQVPPGLARNPKDMHPDAVKAATAGANG
jgi:hypothetical protein